MERYGGFMRYIIMDLEMNLLDRQYKEEREICKQEIIEFGAVMLDDTYQKISSFQTYVKPQYAGEIRKNITKLTGITSEMVANAPVFEEAMKQFTNWCYQFEGPCQVHAWSENDLRQILCEVELKNYEMNEKEKMLIDGWGNFQVEYIEKLGLERIISLEKALDYAGIDFQGQQHDALYDAQNTAELFHIVHDKLLFETKLHAVVEALETKTMETTLGSMFNFAELSMQLA